VRTPLKIAAAQPACIAHDVRANAREHADVIRSAEARVVVFPELSLTGYELDADPVPLHDEALHPIVHACAETGALALVGAPVEGAGGALHIAILRVSGAGVDLVYRKSHLGGDEVGRFTAETDPAAIGVDGWMVGVGICKDTGVEQHIAATAALGVDLYVAGLVHRPDELDLQEERGVRIARTCKAYVAFASFAGPTGGGYDRTAGASSIWAPDGTPLARAGTEPGGIATALLT
jgi:predicted amidohydrolase